MTSLQVIYLAASFAIFGLAWLFGGRAERAATVVLLLGFVASLALQKITLGDLRLGEAMADLFVMAGLAALALKRDRWWLLAACAFMVLTLAAHAVMLMNMGFDTRGDVTARWGLGAAVVTCLLFGVFERWLAGEPRAGSRKAQRGA